MDELYKAHYKKHMTGAIEASSYSIIPGVRLPPTTLLFLTKVTKDYYMRLHRRIGEIMELTEEDINNAATQSLVWYLNGIGFDISTANSKQCVADSTAPTVMDFIVTMIAIHGESDIKRPARPTIVTDDDIESPTTPNESEPKSNTGTSGKFTRFMRNKKHVDGKQLGNEKLDV